MFLVYNYSLNRTFQSSFLNGVPIVAMARSDRRVEKNEILIWKKHRLISTYRSVQDTVLSQWYLLFVVVAIVLLMERLSVCQLDSAHYKRS
jgi:hypothetical protein